MRSLTVSIVIAPLVFGGLPAFAQGSPSADQIINSLKPSGNLVTGGTRGIRLAAPPADMNAQPPAAASHAPAQQPRMAAGKPAALSAAQTPGEAPAMNLTVNFASGSAELTQEAIHTLDALGQALASKDLATYRFRIEGHTDTVGSRDYNQALSKRRAEAVVAYVAKKFGVDPARLEAVGMGEDGLLVTTPPQTPEPRNRRVQVVNLGA